MGQSLIQDLIYRRMGGLWVIISYWRGDYLMTFFLPHPQNKTMSSYLQEKVLEKKIDYPRQGLS